MAGIARPKRRVTCLSALRMAAVVWALLLLPDLAHALDFPERRRDQFGMEPGHYVYPLAGEVPGLGTASGVGATVLNMAGTDTDFTGFALDGDFKVIGGTVLDFPLRPKRLILDFGGYSYDVAPTWYGRGIQSDPDTYILPHARGSLGLAQLTLTYHQRRYEAWFRHAQGASRVTEVLDQAGNAFPVADTGRHSEMANSLGFTADLTDDRVDPRAGVRSEVALRFPRIDDPNRSRFFNSALNLTGYVPVRARKDTLGVNLFYSGAHVTHKGPTDFATLQAEEGFGCAPADTACQTAEADYINDLIAYNRYGVAMPLGGTQRLRSYDNGRYYAGNALFYGVEYRWNLTEEYVPFDFWIMKGVRTGIQLAAFAEQGTVAEHRGDLLSHMRSSYGIGFRVLLSGVVIRADWGTGNEGDTFQLFINYPWSVFSVDNAG